MRITCEGCLKGGVAVSEAIVESALSPQKLVIALQELQPPPRCPIKPPRGAFNEPLPQEEVEVMSHSWGGEAAPFTEGGHVYPPPRLDEDQAKIVKEAAVISKLCLDIPYNPG
ncbi:MAG: hypothetical protein DRO18_07350 [Thermoprotei archaeon]|nr:MAG: hypothetical protein DRO18_07350 [Thermoprotei archaeon]